MTAWLALSLTIVHGKLNQRELVENAFGEVEAICKDWKRRWRVHENEGVTYPCPLTTSFFASCRQMLLRVPGSDVSACISSLVRMRAHHICGCWKMVVVA